MFLLLTVFIGVFVLGCFFLAILLNQDKIYMFSFGRTDRMSNPKSDPSSNFKANILTIKCECGFEILVLADAEDMARAIDSHSEKHRNLEENLATGLSTFERIQGLLIKQLFEKVASESDKE